jgi:acetyl-CoA C-acetyltransferase
MTDVSPKELSSTPSVYVPQSAQYGGTPNYLEVPDPLRLGITHLSRKAAMKDLIRDKVAIVGMGCCKFGENWDKSPEDMIVEAAFEAYADAGIENPQEQIEAVFCGAVYPSKGTAEVADALKLFGRPISMVQNYCTTGTDAFRYGVFSVACGMYDRVMIVGFDKPKDRGVSGPNVQTVGVRGLPMTPAVGSRHAQEYFETTEPAARISPDRGENHHNGTLAPKSMLSVNHGRRCAQAPLISWPSVRLPRAIGRCRGGHSRATSWRKVRDDYVLVKAVAIAFGAEPAESDPILTSCAGSRPSTPAAGHGQAEPIPSRKLAAFCGARLFHADRVAHLRDLGLKRKGVAKEHIESGTFCAWRVAGQYGRRTQDFGHPTGATGA